MDEASCTHFTRGQDLTVWNGVEIGDRRQGSVHYLSWWNFALSHCRLEVYGNRSVFAMGDSSPVWHAVEIKIDLLLEKFVFNLDSFRTKNPAF